MPNEVFIQVSSDYLFNVGVSIHFWWLWDGSGLSISILLQPTTKQLTKETSLCCRAVRNLIRRRWNIRIEIPLSEKNSLKGMIGLSRYNTITNIFREEIVEWLVSHTNVNPQYVSSYVVTVCDPEWNHKQLIKQMLM